jgi:carbamoyl-phosphate synthase small subunit
LKGGLFLTEQRKAKLVLADGTVFEGRGFGARGEAVGEVVFNTSMMGYQEIMTDPSYKGQIVTMTYPLIGNYGTNDEDFESKKPQVEGFIVKENSVHPSSWRSEKTLDDYLKENNIVGIEGIDTRSLTRHIRNIGAQEGVVSTDDLDTESLLQKARRSPGLLGRDLVKEVTCDKGYEWSQGEWLLEKGYQEFPAAKGGGRFNVVAYDLGIKYNILRKLVTAGCNVAVVPAATKAEDVLRLKPDGVFLSNGPGDPAGVPYAAENVKELIGKKPIFGICLGHQILGLALGGKTFKLKFGHRGGNQPVMDLTTQKVEITSQNHGFSVDADSLPDDVVVTHINLNDNTVEGLKHRELPVFSVQYHPEASPGPHDASYLFRRFIEMMKEK